MQYSIQSSGFKPFEIKLVIENEFDLVDLTARINLAYGNVRERNVNYFNMPIHIPDEANRKQIELYNDLVELCKKYGLCRS
jgi:hypothetical protein